MKVNKITEKIYKSRTLKKGLKFASENSALFIAGTSLALSTFVRPLSILATPKAEKKNKELTCAKSVASALIGYLIMLGVSLPLAKGLKRIDAKPTKYLTKRALNNYKGVNGTLETSKSYRLASQIFKLGLGFVIAAPKAIMTSILIVPVSKILFRNEKKDNIKVKTEAQTDVSFGATEHLSKAMGRVLSFKSVRNWAKKYENSNFALNFLALTDSLSTLCFVRKTQKNKYLDNDKKRVLNYNAIISTGLCIASGYVLDKALNKPTERFIAKFRKINAADKNLEKYVEGIKIAKPALILGPVYYALIPMISTFLADKSTNHKKVL